MSLAIFILPIDPLKTELEGWKERVNKELPNQPYALHPPHMTLINIEVLNGITIEQDKFTSETLVTHKNSKFTKIIKRINLINE